MLKLIVGKEDLYDEIRQEFRSSERIVLELEHSLVSLARWESKWEQPFLDGKEKTVEQTYDYVRCMIVGDEPAPEVIAHLSDENMNQIAAYIEAKMTATTMNDKHQKGARETITSELIYYWMIALTIPFEAERWHLNRLLTLIRVCNFKNAPKKKMSSAEMASQRRALNDERRARLHTNG